jgi:hypothetical protein
MEEAWMSEDRIPLGELLRYVSSEVRRVHQEAIAKGEPVMRFAECELELAIEAEGKAEAGLRVWVLKLGGGVKRTEANTIKVKYTALGGDETKGGIVAGITGTKGSQRKIVRQRQGKK